MRPSASATASIPVVQIGLFYSAAPPFEQEPIRHVGFSVGTDGIYRRLRLHAPTREPRQNEQKAAILARFLPFLRQNRCAGCPNLFSDRSLDPQASEVGIGTEGIASVLQAMDGPRRRSAILVGRTQQAKAQAVVFGYPQVDIIGREGAVAGDPQKPLADRRARRNSFLNAVL